MERSDIGVFAAMEASSDHRPYRAHGGAVRPLTPGPSPKGRGEKKRNRRGGKSSHPSCSGGLAHQAWVAAVIILPALILLGIVPLVRRICKGRKVAV
jgi:hypothetical protein